MVVVEGEQRQAGQCTTATAQAANERVHACVADAVLVQPDLCTSTNNNIAGDATYGFMPPGCDCLRPLVPKY